VVEKQETLIVRYQALIAEWNAISIVSAILFASAIIGLVMGLLYFNTAAILITIVLMFIFAAFEHRSRNIYVENKRELEAEILKYSGIKKAKAKDLVNKGLMW
jgi:uncharacterized membrane protein YhiD involved in acid resistance